MCGRFVASRPVEDIVDQFGVEAVEVPDELLPGPRFNIAPQSGVLAVRTRRSGDVDALPERRLSLLHWGLVPSFAKDLSIGNKAFNARAESVSERPMFRAALARRRCIVPADAFYEWQRLGPDGKPLPRGDKRSSASRRPTRQPWCFKAADGSMLGFAGLWEIWRPPDTDDRVLSCTIVTTDANSVVAPVHDRMPVVLRPQEYDEWLSATPLEPDRLRELLAPGAEDLLVAHPVSQAVSNSRSEGEELWVPADGVGEWIDLGSGGGSVNSLTGEVADSASGRSARPKLAAAQPSLFDTGT